VAGRSNRNVRALLLVSMLLGIVLMPRSVAGQSTFTVVGLADCGVASGQRCRFPTLGATLVLVSNDSGSPERYTIVLDWVGDSLPDIDQDDLLSVEIEAQPGGALFAVTVLNVSGSNGSNNPGRSTGSVDAREQPRSTADDDDDHDDRPVIEDAGGDGPEIESQSTWLGPDRFAGRIRSIVIDPTNRNIIYVGAATGGIWKSTNGGVNWVSLDDFMPTQVIGSLAMDPRDPNTIYAGTGEIFTFLAEGLTLRGRDRGQGIFVSRNAGVSWSQLPTTTGPEWRFVSRIAVSPGNSDVILAATDAGLYRSTDGGRQSFRRMLDNTFLDVKFHPAFDASNPANTNAVATRFGGPPVFSTDGGSTWTTTTSAVAFNDRSRVELAPVRQLAREWRALLLNELSGDIRLLTSVDRGQTFGFLVPGGPPLACTDNNRAYTGALWVDPRNAQRMLVGGIALCKSTNGGVDFTRISDPNTNEDLRLGSDFHAIVDEPGLAAGTTDGILVGYDQGVHRIRGFELNPPAAVVNLNDGLRTTQFHSAIAHPGTGNVAGGLQDNGILVRAANVWDRITGVEDGGMATVGGDTFFVALSVGRVNRSAVDGADRVCISATHPTLPLVESSAAGACGTTPVATFCANKTPVLVDPNDSTRLYVGCGQLWRTVNAATLAPASIAWSSIQPRVANFAITAMAIARGNANLMWLGTTEGVGRNVLSNGQVWRSTTVATAANNSFTTRGAGLPARPVADITIRGRFHEKVYVSFSGYADPAALPGDTNVWRTDNGNDGIPVWRSIGAGLPTGPVWSLEAHPTQSGWLYAGTDSGLYISTDDGASWSATARGLSTAAVADLQWKGDTTFLTIATYGRGTHEFDARTNPELLFPESAQVPFGSLIRGRVENLLLSDNKRLVLSKPTLSQDLSAVLTTRGGFTQAATPVGSDLDFSVESVASQDVDQKLELFDFLNNQFVTMQIVRLTAGQERTTNRLFADGASRFINPTTRQLQARLTWTPVRASSTFTVEIDAARWRITR
jgi:hypothetical protein